MQRFSTTTAVDRVMDTKQLMIALDVAYLRHAGLGLTEEMLQGIARDVQKFLLYGEIEKLRGDQSIRRM